MKLTLLKMEITPRAPELGIGGHPDVPDLRLVFKAPGNRLAHVLHVMPVGTDAFEVAAALRRMARDLEHMACSGSGAS